MISVHKLALLLSECNISVSEFGKIKIVLTLFSRDLIVGCVCVCVCVCVCEVIHTKHLRQCLAHSKLHTYCFKVVTNYPTEEFLSFRNIGPFLRRLCVLSHSVMSNFCDPMDSSLPGSSVHGDSPGKNTGVGCHALLQVIFSNQELNPGIPHCRQILYHLSHQGGPLRR